MNQVIKFMSGLGQLGFFSVRIFTTLFRSWPEPRLVFEQMFKIGVETLPVLIAVCTFVGTNIALVGYHIFKGFGGQEFLGAYVGLSCLREMAPILTGALMAAKPGTAATKASMKVSPNLTEGQSSSTPRSMTCRISGKLAHTLGPT